MQLLSLFHDYTAYAWGFFHESPFESFLFLEFPIVEIENNQIETSERITYSAPDEPRTKWGWFKFVVGWSAVALVAATAIIPSYNYILLYIKISNDLRK